MLLLENFAVVGRFHVVGYDFSPRLGTVRRLRINLLPVMANTYRLGSIGSVSFHYGFQLALNSGGYEGHGVSQREG